MSISVNQCKPFLKWAGGKTQLLGDIEKALPKEIYKWKSFTYIEPFAGSGAVLFWMLKNFPNLKTAILNDVNPDLMNAYAIVKSKPQKLITVLKEFKNKYTSIESEEKRKEFFLKQREIYNSGGNDKVLHAALLIFLNRTCFNGLYRVNSKGKFNVPFGKYANPNICDEQTILADSKVLQKVELLKGDFEKTLDYANGEETFFYFDPPYKPLTNTSSFTSYSKDGFNDVEQERLKDFCKLVSLKGYLFLLSNSDTGLNANGKNYFDKLYSNFNIEKVFARRSINANAEKRGVLKELLIKNYKTEAISV